VPVMNGGFCLFGRRGALLHGTVTTAVHGGCGGRG
jgi:hypothetical protein